MYRHELSLPTCVHGLYSARKSKHCPWAKSEICNFVQFSTHFSWVWKVSWPLYFTDMASLVFEQDDKEEELLAQALYVDEDRLDVDEDDQRPPASGEEYLKKVVRESKKFKFVETGNFCFFFIPKVFLTLFSLFSWKRRWTAWKSSRKGNARRQIKSRSWTRLFTFKRVARHSSQKFHWRETKISSSYCSAQAIQIRFHANEISIL